jgi:hypothetical protein
LENLARELAAINDHFQKELYTIKTDERYTPKGRDLLTQQLGDTVLEKLKPYAGAYNEHIAGVKKTLFNPPNTQKSEMAIMLEYLKNQEIRSMHNMAGMDLLELEAQIDDPDFLEAVVTSPKPLLPADRLNELLIKKAETENPDAAELLDQYGYASGTVKSLVNTIKGDIKASGWKEDDAQIEKAA